MLKLLNQIAKYDSTKIEKFTKLLKDVYENNNVYLLIDDINIKVIKSFPSLEDNKEHFNFILPIFESCKENNLKLDTVNQLGEKQIISRFQTGKCIRVISKSKKGKIKVKIVKAYKNLIQYLCDINQQNPINVF